MMRQMAVVFDMDDTLYLERDYVRSGFLAVGRWVHEHLGRDGFFDEAWQLFESGTRGNIFNLVLTRWGMTPDSDLVAQLVQVYREHTPDIALLPDAEQCLAYLKGKVRLALITDGALPSQRAKALQLGMDRWMDKIVLTAELGAGYSKPHPRAFREVEAAFGLSGQQCVYVADNPAKDFDAPRELGWKYVRIRRSGSLHSEAASPSPIVAEIDTLDSLPDIVAV